LIGGGFEYGIVTQVYGEAGSGKTNLAIQLSIACVRENRKVIFIDTEGFSPARFKQIAGDEATEIAKNIIVYEPTDFASQHSAVCNCEKIMSSEVGLIIFDSPVMFYRQKLNESEHQILRRQLASQLSILHSLARRYKVAVLVTNQVYTDVDTNLLVPLGGNPLAHISKTIIQLEKIAPQRRRAILQKHRFRPEGITCEFTITQSGLR
jgi:DNA repair protein RadB